MAYKWFFVRVQSGREDSIRRQLETRIKAGGVQDVVPQIIVPFERVTDLKSGKKKVVSRKLYPGYLMVQSDIDDRENPRVQKALTVMRETPGFGDFLGSRGEATAISEQEVSGILSKMSESEQRPQISVSLRKSDMVKIKTGAFEGFDGQVEDVNPDKGTVRVIVTIFGRPTPVEVEYWEVEQV
jgi:transcriptional antiterminator NusG